MSNSLTHTPARPNMLDSALWFAKFGYKVFPCKLNKKPLTPNGHLNATTDSDQITSWWTEYPRANIGIATAGLLILDIDGAQNPWLESISGARESLSGYPLVISARGGQHYYMLKPAGKTWRCTESDLGHKIDTRTDGGYIIAPPSKFQGKLYCWADGCGLDCTPDQLPLPPQWLVERLDAIHPPIAENRKLTSNIIAVEQFVIPDGQRNGALASFAGKLRHIGCEQPEIDAALQAMNQLRCQPPLDSAEVSHIAQSIARYEKSNLLLPEGSQSKEPFRFQSYSSSELANCQDELDYLINGLLVAGQPGIIAGPKKTLKTNISVDLAISLSQGVPFLGNFHVTRPVRTGIMSGESGRATILETASRVACAKGLEFNQCEGVRWCFDVPRLDQVEHIQAMREFVEQYQLEVLILDPAYLMMMGLGNDASNLFVVGKLLDGLANLIKSTGCTPLICHHFNRSAKDPFEVPQIDHIAYAGFQEFMRQWILLNRRKRFDPNSNGNHELWLNVGGSAGHMHLYRVDIEEGTRQCEGGRYWQVDVIDGEIDIDSRKSGSSDEAELEKRVDAARAFLELHPAGETKTAIRDVPGVGKRHVDQVIGTLLELLEIETCTFEKNTRTENGFRLTSAVVPGRPGRPSGRARGGGRPALYIGAGRTTTPDSSRVVPKLSPFDFSEIDYSFV